jgi:hypothetical protein
MSDLRTAAQQALEALEELNGWQSLAPPLASQAGRQAAISLRAALEQPNQGGKTGWPPGLLQDDCRGLSKWLASQPDARRRVREAVAALEQPQPEQEPVAWMDPNSGEVCRAHWLESHAPERDVDRFSCPLYTHTHPPRREWRGLTEEEIQSVIQLEREKRFQRRPPLPLSMTELSHAIEAKLKEKNHD